MSGLGSLGPVLLLTAAIAVLGLLLTLVVSRRRSDRHEAPPAALDSLAAQVATLGEELADLEHRPVDDRVGAASAPGSSAAPGRHRAVGPSDLADAVDPADAWDPAEPAEPAEPTDVPAPVLTTPAEPADALPDPGPGRPVRPDQPDGVAGYDDVARALREEGRDHEAAVASWAAGLRGLAGRLEGHHDELWVALRAPGADHAALADGAVATAVSLAGRVLAGSRGTVVPDPVVHEEPRVLRARAHQGVEEAQRLRTEDPEAARAAAWQADLAAFDAVVVDAAHRAGDARLASVRLRRRLAMVRLADAQGFQGVADPGLDQSVAQVRETLADVLEPHERPVLAATLAPWPAA